MKTAIYSMLFTCAFNISHAYFALSNVPQIDNQKPTRVIIAGIPEKLGNLLLESAKTKARVYTTINKDDQIIILGTSDDNQFATASKDFNLLEMNKSLLSGKVITKYIENLKSIESVDLYAHSNAVSGVIVDKNSFGGFALSENDAIWDLVKSKISPKSFVMIHGCNAGVRMAPNLAKKLEVAVFGALTSSDFQNIYNQNTWAFDYDNQNLERNKSDNRVRMRPINSVYKGHWGDWTDGGFPTYKLFCGNASDVKCATSSFEAISTFPSVVVPKAELTKEEYQNILIDFMCPVSTYRNTFEDCKNNLINLSNQNKTYSPYRGITLNCSRVSCEAEFKCSKFAINYNPSKCKLINNNLSPSTSFTEDYDFMLNAFDLRVK